jgi:hypothetical protein
MLKEGDVRLRRGFVLERGAAQHAGCAAMSVPGLRPSGQRSAVPIRSRRIGLLLGQKKVAKEKAARLPLESCASHFRPGSPEGASVPLWRHAESLPRPLRAVPAESSGARRGKRDNYLRKRSVFSFIPYGAPEHRCLEPDQPVRGAAGSRAATKEQGCAFCRPRVPDGNAQDQRAIRVPADSHLPWCEPDGRASRVQIGSRPICLWVPFLWASKEKELVCGAKPAFKTTAALAAP